MASIADRLKQLDAYPKTLEDFKVKTYGGATLTILSSAIILLLFLSELVYFLSTDVRQELYVDTSRGDKLTINVDVVFHRASCLLISIDVMDVSGEHQLDVLHSMFKQRLTLEGAPIIDEPPTKAVLASEDDQFDEAVGVVLNSTAQAQCGSCYGAESEPNQCCNTCEEVREAYRHKGWAFNDPSGISQCVDEGWTVKIKEQVNEGCQIHGSIGVNKVAGNLHFAPGKSFQQHSVHVHDLQPFGLKQFNMSHTINKLSFGAEYPGIVNPLDGHSQFDNSQGDNGGVMFQYFVKVVPTMYQSLDGSTMGTNQFSVTMHQRKVKAVTGESGLPGLFIIYDLSPILVQLSEHKRSFMHFLTSVCAIVGGVFTVAGMIDGFFYHSSRILQKKIELGKLS